MARWIFWLTVGWCATIAGGAELLPISILASGYGWAMVIYSTGHAGWQRILVLVVHLLVDFGI